MLVKAKWNVADASGWHNAGEVFDTKEDLGKAVEVLVQEAVKPVKAAEAVTDVNVQKPEQEKPVMREPQRRNSTRLKTDK